MITARPKKTNVSPDPKNGLRVLVVEDEPDTAASMAWLLGLWGHEARVARDGETALECLRNGCPDVVLLDLGLPGMGGREVAARLKDGACPKKPLVVALTGYADEDSRARCAPVVDLHLAKPVDLGVLQGLLGRFHAVIKDE